MSTNKSLKSVCIDLIYKTPVSCVNNVSFNKDVCIINVK